MTIQDYITAFALEFDHSHTNATMLKYINFIESNIDILKEYLNAYYPRVLDTFQFTLPSGVDFEDVTKLYVNGVKYKKKDTRAYKEKYSYWYEGSKICIYPVCSATDDSYVSGAGEITFASATITTTGDDFSGISVGDVILVSGATTSANNKYATVIEVDDAVLTFATGTFSAGLDAAAVTVSVPKIKLTYLSRTTTKLIADIATDTLSIPDRWIQVYDFWIMSKMAYLAKDYAEAQNHTLMYNAEVKRFEDYWEDHRPQQSSDDIQAVEDWDSGDTASFDEE